MRATLRLSPALLAQQRDGAAVHVPTEALTLPQLRLPRDTMKIHDAAEVCGERSERRRPREEGDGVSGAEGGSGEVFSRVANTVLLTARKVAIPADMGHRSSFYQVEATLERMLHQQGGEKLPAGE